MRLTHISVEGCGRFVERVVVSGLAPGLNVLSAPNESGKSTLFKAVRACLFEKHTSKALALRELASEAAAKPLTIEVGFVHGGRQYLARKVFLSSPRASLHCDGQEIAGGGHADEKLHEILGLRASGRGIDEGAFGLLWVRQSDSFSQAAVDGAAREGLDSAIEREVGTLVGGERARETLKTLNGELGALFTDKGQAKRAGPLGVAEDRVRAAADEVAAAQRLLAELESDLDMLERKRRERARLADPAAAAEMGAKLRQAKADLISAEDAAREIEALAQAEQLASLARDEAARTLDELRAAARALDDAVETQAGLAGEIAAAENDRAELSRKLDDVRKHLDEIEAGDERDARQDAHLRRLGAAASAAARLPELETRAARLAAADAERTTLQQQLAALRAAPRHVQALDKIEQESAIARARLEAAATRVCVTPSPGAAVPITLDGREIGAATSFAATHRAVLAVAGVGEIVIEPPARFAEEAQARLRELDQKRARVLEDAGAADGAALREQAAARETLEAQLAALWARVQAFGSSAETLAADLAGARDEAARIQASVEALLGAGETLPDGATLEAKQDALAQRRKQTALRRTACTAETGALTQSLMEIGARAAALRAQAEGLARQIEDGLKRLPPAERASRLASAAETFERRLAAHRTALLALQQAQERAPGAERLEKLRERVARLEQGRANEANALHALDTEIAGLGARIQLRGGEGLGERVAALADDHAIAVRDAQRIRARADALTLLRATITTCYEEHRDKLQTPLRNRLQPFLDDVFPRAEITLDERFAVERIVRAGATEAFDRLSAGAQEQIAILVRLAMGALLRERGEDVPIILDDALVFCDDERIEHMFDALNRAARAQQVIVLTCRGASFRSLGGQQLAIEAAR